MDENLKEQYEKKLEDMLAEAGITTDAAQAIEEATLEEEAIALEALEAEEEESLRELGLLDESEAAVAAGEAENSEENAAATKESGVDDANMEDIREQLDPRIQRALDDMGFAKLTPIQEQAIPALLTGRDIIGQAQTGTGKTAAFGIPLIQRVNPDLQKLQAIVLCPTRELAIQAALELRKLAKYIEALRILPVYGGQEIGRQIRALPGTQISVGTPGRVMDHMNRHTIKLDNVSMVVLDEADEMLNMGFREDMEVILGAIEGDHQTALFSATMPKPILDITKKFQKEDTQTIRIATGELTIPLISQKFFLIKNQDKDAATVRLLEYYDPRLCLIFCNTKAKVEELSEVLKKNNFQAEGLHGDLIQHQRDIVMGRFRNGSTNILIATDVAARGIDVDDVEIVINYDVPLDNEYYVHRIGRTGRAGKTGMSFTFANARELRRIREIERFCKTTIEEKKLPDASKVLKSKARKVLNTAWELKDHEDIDLMKVYLQRKMDKDGCDIMDLAACMLKQQIGDKGEEILEDKPQPRQRGPRSRGDRDGRGFSGRGFGRRDGEDRGDRDFGGRGFGRRDGEDRGDRGFGRGFGRRDGEDRGDRGFGRRDGEDRGDRGFGGRGFGRRDGEERSNRSFRDQIFGEKENGEKSFAGDKSFGDKKFGDKKFSDKGFGRRRDEDEDDFAPKKKKEPVKFWEMEKPVKKKRGDFEEKEGALEKHQAKKERKGAGAKASKFSQPPKKASAKSGKGGKLDARKVLDVDQFGRPKKVKK
ncbi:MAG: DEAD/DEAH box helicase [Lachnospiraceae bacterium]|nr:DEAD/DEAH box helicase [Lachnospiraceae bacterium]